MDELHDCPISGKQCRCLGDYCWQKVLNDMDKRAESVAMDKPRRPSAPPMRSVGYLTEAPPVGDFWSGVALTLLIVFLFTGIFL